MSFQDPRPMVEARARLMVKAVFFSFILYDQTRVTCLQEDSEGKWMGIPVPTAMTDGYNIVVNLEFFGKLSIEERVFVLAHEIYHVMAMHPKRMRKYSTEGLCSLPFVPELFNIAADIVINKCLKLSNIGKAPKDGVFVDKIGNYVVKGDETAEEIYEKLLDDNPQLKKALGQMSSGLDSIKKEIRDQGGSLGNDVLPISPDSMAGTVNEPAMKAAIVAATQQAKAQGTMPAGLKRFVDEFLEPKVRWEDQLRTTLVSKGTGTTTWAKPNRRKIVSPGVYLPRRIGMQVGDIVVAVDTSGSTAAVITQFLGEVASILGDVKPKSLYLIWCDAKVDGVEELTEPEDLRQATMVRGIGGGGGTSFVPPFEWIKEHDLPCDVMIYLTDGYGPFPSEGQAPFETIWAINTDVTGPFGQTIRIQ